jgi:hypothetical protein
VPHLPQCSQLDTGNLPLQMVTNMLLTLNCVTVTISPAYFCLEFKLIHNYYLMSTQTLVHYPCRNSRIFSFLCLLLKMTSIHLSLIRSMARIILDPETTSVIAYVGTSSASTFFDAIIVFGCSTLIESRWISRRKPLLLLLDTSQVRVVDC